MAQVTAGSTVHDVVIIGSGAGGGTVTKVLADLGIRVLLMEAGPMVTMDDFKNLASPLNDWHRGAGDAATLYTTNTGAAFAQPSVVFPPNAVDEPYTVAPGSQFRWSRSRCIGGRTNHYSRVQLRYSDYDFKNKSMKGVGFDWPIGYADLAPYYDKAERLVGVTGRPEGLRTAPDGIFQTPAAFKPHEHLIYRSCEKLGIKATSARQAVITSAMNGREACVYCGQCGRGCHGKSNYASSYVQIFPAMETGRVTVLANAMARELVTDASGKVTAVSYIDKTTGQERQVRCRTVVLAAAAPESARLLLNSKSPRYPHGIGNSGGNVGKYLTDTVGFGLSATVPYMRGTPPFTSAGYGSHIYIPWWVTDHSKLDFPLGYHVECGGGGFAVPGLGFAGAAYGQSEGYGLPLKKAIRDSYGMGTNVSLTGRGSCVPNEDSYAEIDPAGTKDKWGIPVLRFHWKWSDHELNQARHMRDSFTAILEGMGGVVNAAARGGGPGGRGVADAAGAAGAAAGQPNGGIPGVAAGGPGARGGAAAPGATAAGTPGAAGGPIGTPGVPGALGAGAASTAQTPPAQAADDRPQLGAGGGIIHEVGCVRMGTSADNSVVNSFCRVHDVPNVFSADGGPFASHADKNPTHTIIALAWRTAEYLAEELRKGNV
ncbi:MAG: GMC family oxidoreductase [Vicinamibacterales bacterium]